MPDQRPPLLLTRPRAASERFATEFRARFGKNWPVTIAPLIEIAALPAAVPKADAVIFTSENAVAPFVAVSPPAGRRAYCVGGRTGKVARAAGFEVISGPGDAVRLLPLILAHHSAGSLVHARGRHIAAPLADQLNSAGIETFEAVVYEQRDQPLAAQAAALLHGTGPVLVPLFSPRSAALFAGFAQDSSAELLLAPISAAAAAPCANLPRAALELAERPEATSVLDALARHLQKRVTG